MAFCQKCGAQLADGAAFCASCGTPVGSTGTENQRRQVYEGEIRKCPSCGAVLNAFEAVCPSCGFELRSTKLSSSIEAFVKKLDELGATEKGDNLLSGYFGYMSKAAKQKINYIKSFVVPNTKEDVFEFMILAATNIDEDAYKSTFISQLQGKNFAEMKQARTLSDAWGTKFEQVYQKAKLSFGNDADFQKIQDIYTDKIKIVKDGRKKSRIRIIIGISVFVLIYAVLFGWAGLYISQDEEKRENERLETIVLEIEEDIAKENFSSALLKANRLHFEKSDGEKKKHWDETRESLLQLIETERERTGK